MDPYSYGVVCVPYTTFFVLLLERASSINILVHFEFTNNIKTVYNIKCQTKSRPLLNIKFSSFSNHSKKKFSKPIFEIWFKSNWPSNQPLRSPATKTKAKMFLSQLLPNSKIQVGKKYPIHHYWIALTVVKKIKIFSIWFNRW